MTRRRVLLIVLIAMDIPIFAGLAWYWVSWRPWLADPPEPLSSIDRRWDELTKAGARTGLEDSGQIGFSTALEDLRTVRTTVETLAGRSSGDPIPVLADADLPEAARSAIARLVAWHRSGTTALDPCSRNVRPAETILLCRIALATSAADPAGPRVEAVLHLTQRLRTDGGSVGAVLGVQMAAMTATWAAAGFPAARPLLEKYRPTAAEVIAAWAYGATCDYSLAGRDLSKLRRYGPLARWGFSLAATNGPPLSMVLPERELVFARKTLADDWDRFRTAFGWRPDGDDVLPDFDPATPSVLARILAGDGREVGGRLARTIAEFDATVASIGTAGAEASP